MADPLASPGYGPLEYLTALRTLISQSTTFQAWVGAADSTAALRHIHWFGVDPPLPWVQQTAYALGQVVDLANDTLAGRTFVFQCTTAGTSGATAPLWSNAINPGDIVSDGSTLRWTARTIVGDPRNTAVRLARPFAAVKLGDQITLDQTGYKGDHVAGDLAILFEIEVPAEYTNTVSDAGRWFLLTMTKVLKEIRALAGTAGYLNATDIVLQEIARTPEDRTQVQGDAFLAFVTLTIEGPE